MFKRSVTKLACIPKACVEDWLSGFETIIYDCDGVLWEFDKAIDGSVETFNQIQATGRNAFLVSNTSCISSGQMLEKARTLGFKVDDNHAINAAYCVASYLAAKNFRKSVYVVGGLGLIEELQKVNIRAFRVEDPPVPAMPLPQLSKEMELDPSVGAVVVGRHDHFSLSSICRAANYLRKPNTLFLGSGMDAAYPIGNNRVLVGAAAAIAAIKTMSLCKPFIVGKPNPWIVKQPIDCGAINPETTLVIGDTMETDMQLAHFNGFQSLLVGTGVSTLQEAEKVRDGNKKSLRNWIPDTYLPSLADLRQFLK